MENLTIRLTIGAAEYPALVEIWRSAVEATHVFLSPSDREEIAAHLPGDYLPAVELRVAQRDGRPVGFSGVSGDELQMLFVDASARGSGVGSALLQHAIRSQGVSRVDVNEQNPRAAGFYAHHGFEVAGRSERDDAGRPYPILHLRLATPWQLRTLSDLRAALPGAEVEAYGSATDPASLDAWSDLDVRIRTDAPVDVAAALGAPIWTFQHSTTEERTVVRTVLADGRAVDLSILEGSAVLPEPPSDAAVRFDAALAATRFGRGNELIGLHLTLGVLRETLVQGMLLADRSEGTDHHRFATGEDARARDVLRALQGPLTPWTALEAFSHFAARLREVDPSYRPDATGLEALIRRGTAGRTS
ncbi:acetyltransferase [Brachybacterium halotolerans]|uniref:acetyltransferase n=1 Tax=Brachybacterium halotolerans TaxID=2795215 RepID=UPI002B1E2A15|nr:acetyltransferase [Brachybacterium halotolerans]